MIVTLLVEKRKNRNIAEFLSSLFVPFKISSRVRKQYHVSVLQIRYQLMRGKINFGWLYPCLSGKDLMVLCDKNTDLSSTKLTRFESSDFNRAMMLSFIRNMNENGKLELSGVRAAYFDPMGEHPDEAEQLAEILPGLMVITDMPKYYEIFADNLMDEKGLVLTVSNDYGQFTDKQLVVTSGAIDRNLPLSSQSIVFSPERPLVSTKCSVLWKFAVETPQKYSRLKPDWIDDEYFLSALYSLEGIKKLESLIPDSAGSGNESFTDESLIRRLCAIKKSA